MSTQIKIYLGLFTAVLGLVAWWLFKETIVATFWTLTVSGIVLGILYMALRIWWWRRKRRNGAGSG